MRLAARRAVMSGGMTPRPRRNNSRTTKEITADAREFLQRDPDARPAASALLAHPFLVRAASAGELSTLALDAFQRSSESLIA